VRFIVGDVLRGGGGSGKFPRPSLEEIKRAIGSELGLGRDAVLKVLDGTPGLNADNVRQQLARITSPPEAR
jgi:hypothetical protein